MPLGNNIPVLEQQVLLFKLECKSTVRDTFPILLEAYAGVLPPIQRSIFGVCLQFSNQILCIFSSIHFYFRQVMNGLYEYKKES